MMPRLAAEEELVASMNALHPYLEPNDQRSRVRRLQAAAGYVRPVVKATYADLMKIGIKVNDGS